jgi:hypothetical protein
VDDSRSPHLPGHPRWHRDTVPCPPRISDARAEGGGNRSKLRRSSQLVGGSRPAGGS